MSTTPYTAAFNPYPEGSPEGTANTAGDLQVVPPRPGEAVVVLAVDFTHHDAVVVEVDPSDAMTITADVQTNVGRSQLSGLRYGASRDKRPGWARPADLALDPTKFQDADPAAVARRKAIGPQAGDVVLYVEHHAGEIKAERVRVLGRSKDPMCLTLQGDGQVRAGVIHGWGHARWIWPDEARAERKLSQFELSPDTVCSLCHQAVATVNIYVGDSNRFARPTRRMCEGCSKRFGAFTAPGCTDAALARA